MQCWCVQWEPAQCTNRSRVKTVCSSAEPWWPGPLRLPLLTAVPRLSENSSRWGLLAEPWLLEAAWSLFGCLLGLSFVYCRHAKICKDLATLVFFSLKNIYFLIYWIKGYILVYVKGIWWNVSMLIYSYLIWLLQQEILQSIPAKRYCKTLMDRARDFHLFSHVGACQLLQVGKLWLRNSLQSHFPQRSLEHSLITANGWSGLGRR